RSGQAVRIIYSLWNVPARSQITSGTVDGSASDLFGMQDQVADRLADGLKVRRTTRTPTPAGLSGAEAQERYLQALGHLLRYDKRTRVEEAIGILEKLQSEQPASALVPAALGRAYLYEYSLTHDRRFADSAEKVAARARELDPALPEVDITLGELYARTGKPARAIEAFDRALAVRPNSFDALLGLASGYEKSGDGARAESTYQRAVRLQPEYFGGYSKLAGYYFRQGRNKEAAEAFRRVTELAPDNARGFANLGAADYALGDFDRALSAFQKSLDIEPTEVAYTNVGTVEYLLGRYSDAARAFQSAIKVAPNDSQLWMNLGDCYRWMPGNEARATEAYRKAAELARAELAVNPRNALSHAMLAVSLAKTEQPVPAREHADLSRSLEPKNPNVLFAAAVVAEVGGRRTDAIELLRSALNAGFPARAAELDPELKKIREDRGF